MFNNSQTYQIGFLLKQLFSSLKCSAINVDLCIQDWLTNVNLQNDHSNSSARSSPYFVCLFFLSKNQRNMIICARQTWDTMRQTITSLFSQTVYIRKATEIYQLTRCKFQNAIENNNRNQLDMPAVFLLCLTHSCLDWNNSVLIATDKNKFFFHINDFIKNNIKRNNIK